MNKVTMVADEYAIVDVAVEDLIGENMRQHECTAFIGYVNHGERGLHLITYSNITNALTPSNTYKKGTCHVERYVDVEMHVKYELR